jgi:hypothetical protein
MGRPKRHHSKPADAPTLAAAAPEGERGRGFRAVGAAVSKLAAPIIIQRGGGILTRLKSDWGTIIGPDWSTATWPTALGRDGVLKLRTASGAAVELQHRAPLLIERINLFFGRSVVTRLALVQGPLPLPPVPTGPAIRPLAACAAMALDKRLSGVADPELRAALAQLARAVVGVEP